MEKKNLLIVSYKIPYPLSQGGAIAQFFFLKKLTTVFNVTFCTIVSNQNQLNNLESLKQIVPEISLKVYQDSVNNEKESFEKQIIKHFDKLNRRVKKKLLYLFKRNRHVLNNNRLDNSFEFVHEEFVEFFKNVLEGEKYNIIQLEFFETLALIPIIPKNIQKIVVHHEVRSKRNGLINYSNTFYKHYIEKITFNIEKTFLNMADSVVVFNEEDKDYLQEVSSKIQVSPFGIPKKLIVKKEVSRFFNKLIFIGSEFHFPNKEGLEWFLDIIYIPNIEIINWPLHITGFWSETFKKKYTIHKKVVFTGFVQNLGNIYENAMLVAPIISGSGVRTKILEAFSNKIPVISTVFASEGLYKQEKESNHIIHFNSSTSFIKEFEILKQDPNLIIDLANKGFNYFLLYFDEDLLFNKRLSIYNTK
ncbi:MAG: glycosyltransferase family 4 protein [Zetaproteobacteria bacterium]|nr:glycosyltransferase family 4 protein [Zetaproteobacteria bacterium]PIV93390.1 MAG: hypothetical protein COW44_09735 [Flavobacteriaceae bacterium CG17_big_fil_post_rev_8_21_14_2_50_33_15]